MAGEVNLLKRPGDGALTNVIRPQLSHLSLRLVAVLRSEGTECLPIGNFMAMPRLGSDVGLKITRSCFALQPKVDGVTADAEVFARFATLHAIEFDRLDDFTAQVRAIGSSYGSDLELDNRASLRPNQYGYCYKWAGRICHQS